VDPAVVLPLVKLSFVALLAVTIPAVLFVSAGVTSVVFVSVGVTLVVFVSADVFAADEIDELVFDDLLAHPAAKTTAARIRSNATVFKILLILLPLKFSS
jgi:hypothetical protein